MMVGLALDKSEVIHLSDRAFRAYVRAAAFAVRELTDGALDNAQLEELGIRGAVRKELLSKGAWDASDGGIQIRYHLAENSTRADIEARRAKAAERMRRHREQRIPYVLTDVRANGTANGGGEHGGEPRGEQGSSVPQTPSDRSGSGSSPDPEASPVPSSDPKDLKESARVSEERAKIAEVFDGWQGLFRKQKSKLDDKRERRIRKLLRHGFTVEQLILAMKNAKLDPFLMGKNQDGKVYNGIQTLLRDPEQVERLLELKPMNGSGGVSAPYHAPANVDPEVPMSERPTYEEIKAMTRRA